MACQFTLPSDPRGRPWRPQGLGHGPRGPQYQHQPLGPLLQLFPFRAWRPGPHGLDAPFPRGEGGSCRKDFITRVLVVLRGRLLKLGTVRQMDLRQKKQQESPGLAALTHWEVRAKGAWGQIRWVSPGQVAHCSPGCRSWGPLVFRSHGPVGGEQGQERRGQAPWRESCPEMPRG